MLKKEKMDQGQRQTDSTFQFNTIQRNLLNSATEVKQVKMKVKVLC